MPDSQDVIPPNDPSPIISPANPLSGILSQYTPAQLQAARARGMMLPSGVPSAPPSAFQVNSQGLPYSASMNAMSPQERANAQANDRYIREHPREWAAAPDGAAAVEAPASPSPDHQVAGGLPTTNRAADQSVQFINWIGQNEGADWHTLYGNVPGWDGKLTTTGIPIVNGQPWQGGVGPDGLPTHAWGKLQFEPATWVQNARELGIDVTDGSPMNQARVALHVAQKIDPNFLDKFAAGDRAGLAAELQEQWPSLGRFASGGGPPPLNGPEGDWTRMFDYDARQHHNATAAAQARLRPLYDQLAALKDKALSGDPEADAHAEQLRGEIDQAFSDWQRLAKNPPVERPVDLWRNFGSAAVVLAMLGGLLARQHLTAALTAGGAALGAINANNHEQFEQSYQVWEREATFGLDAIKLKSDELDRVLNDRKASLDETLSRARLIADQAGMVEYSMAIADGDVDRLLQLRAGLANALAAGTDQRNKIADEQMKNQLVADRMKQHPEESQAQARLHVEQEMKENPTAGWTIMLDSANNNKPYRIRASDGQAFDFQGNPYTPGGAERPGGAPRAPTGEAAYTQSLIRQKESELHRSLNDAERADIEKQAHADWARAAAKGREAVTVDPKTIEPIAQAIASYRMAPISGWALRGPWGEAVMARVYALDPGYDQTKYAAKVRGEVAFTSGRQGDAVRRISVSVDHLATAEEASQALATGNERTLSRLRITIQREFGYEGPIDFEFVRQIVGSEVSLATLGGIGGEQERDALRAAFDAANSPEQMAGVARIGKQLMADQLAGYRRQAGTAGFSKQDFENAISPRAKQELEKIGHGSAGAQPEPPHPPIPSALRGKDLQWSASRKQWRDKAAGAVYDQNGNKVP